MEKDEKLNPYLKYFVKETQPKPDYHFNINIDSSAAYDEVLATVSKRSQRTNVKERRKLFTARRKSMESVTNSDEHRVKDINLLLKAIMHENVDTVLEVLNKNEFDVNIQDNYLWTPLMCACHRGDVDVVELLINRGANITVKDMAGNTPLSIAKNCKHMNVYELLLKRQKEKMFLVVENKSSEIIECESKPELEENPKVDIHNESSGENGKFHVDVVQEKSTDPGNKRAYLSNHVDKKNANNEPEVICISSSDSEEEQSMSLCTLCNINVVDENYKEHLLSTVHQFYKQLKAIENNDKQLVKPVDYSIPEENKGFQLLLKSGWTQQSGLGKFKSGIRAPIKTKMKADRKGIGTKKQETKKLHKILPEFNVKFNPRLRKHIEKSKEIMFRNDLNGN